MGVGDEILHGLEIAGAVTAAVGAAIFFGPEIAGVASVAEGIGAAANLIGEGVELVGMGSSIAAGAQTLAGAAEAAEWGIGAAALATGETMQTIGGAAMLGAGGGMLAGGLIGSGANALHDATHGGLQGQPGNQVPDHGGVAGGDWQGQPNPQATPAAGVIGDVAPTMPAAAGHDGWDLELPPFPDDDYIPTRPPRRRLDFDPPGDPDDGDGGKGPFKGNPFSANNQSGKVRSLSHPPSKTADPVTIGLGSVAAVTSAIAGILAATHPQCQCSLGNAQELRPAQG